MHEEFNYRRSRVEDLSLLSVEDTELFRALLMAL